jgi:hypothetical protein
VTPNCVRAQSRVFTRRRLRSPSDPKHPAATPGLVRRTTHRPRARRRRPGWAATTPARPSGQAQQDNCARLRGPRVQARANGSPPADPSTDTGNTRPALKIQRCRSRNCSRQLQRSHPRNPPGKSQEPRPPGLAATRSQVAPMAGIRGTYSRDTRFLATSLRPKEHSQKMRICRHFLPMRAEGLEPPRAFAHRLLSSRRLVQDGVESGRFAGYDRCSSRSSSRFGNTWGTQRTRWRASMGDTDAWVCDSDGAIDGHIRGKGARRGKLVVAVYRLEPPAPLRRARPGRCGRVTCRSVRA